MKDKQNNQKDKKLKNSSLILNIFKGLKDLQAKHDTDFASIDSALKGLVLKAVSMDYSDCALSKQNDIASAIDDIEEVMSTLLSNAQDDAEIYQHLKNSKQKLNKINALLGETTDSEFYSLEKSLRSKIYNALGSLIESFEQLVEHRDYEDFGNHSLDLNSIYESFEEQKEKSFEDTGSHKTLSDLRDILVEITL